MCKQNRKSRREFLKMVGDATMMGAVAPLSVNLASIGQAAALNATDGYKALVCVFLYGGNDHNNTLVPYDQPNYDIYKQIRTGIALSRADLLPLNHTNMLADPSWQYSLHPSLAPLQSLFNTGKLATVFNVGALQVPTTLQQYNAKSVPLPPKIFSHNDQQSIWKTGKPEGAVLGRGGKLADLAHASNNRSLFTSISTWGNSVFLAGEDASQYQLGSKGAVEITKAKIGATLSGSSECSQLLRELITRPRTNYLEEAISNINGKSMVAYETVNGALNSIDGATAVAIDNYLPVENKLARQLNVIAKMIHKRMQVDDLKRQVFFVGISGFDNHDNLLENHQTQLTQLGEALGGFYQALEYTGMENKVTTFTASEFGRTFTSNGDGSDHGWGGHHFVMGGAVNGGKHFGQIPEIALKTQLDTGRGRLLPTTSIAEYIGTLAKWFGVSASEMPLVVPAITEFNNHDLGFMRV